MTLEETRKWIVSNIDENTRWRDYGGGMTDKELMAFQDNMRRMDREAGTSQLYGYEHEAMRSTTARLRTVRDAVAEGISMTQFERRIRDTSQRDYERLRSGGLSVRTMNEMLQAIEHDLMIIEDMPATTNLTWEHRRKSTLVGMLQERIRHQEQMERDERERRASLDPYGTYYHPTLNQLVNGDEALKGWHDKQEPKTATKPKPNPLHPVKRPPRKMILDRS